MGFLPSLAHLQNDRYVVLKKLGEGGKGVVYKARDTVLDRVVAIKLLKSAVAEEEAYARFVREAKALGKLGHPNIVSIYDIGKDEEKQFLVLEFVDGMSLRELIGTYPEGKCDIRTVLRIGTDVCSALLYAHSHGVLHRDVKPENIMITREDTAKLMDFGLARMLGQPGITQEGIIVGTVAYLAPEIALGRGGDAQSDLYSFGAVLYEMVTGRPPFVGEDAVKVIFSHIHDYPVSPGKLNPKAPPALTDCIVRLLEKEPEKRYQSAADLLKVFRDIAESFLQEAYGSSAKAVAPASPAPCFAEGEIQLINRTGEMVVLREAVDKAIRGEGSLVFLFGEPGIGKTRLTRELGTYARLRGMQVVYSRYPALFRMDGVPPYVLWSDVVKNCLENCNPEQLYRVVGYYPSEICKLVPDLANRLGPVPPSMPINPEHERDRLFEAVSQFVTNISREAPLLVVLDDLQWTDQSSLLLMLYLARGVYRAPMLILGAYRDTDIDEKHVLSSVLTELNRERLLKSMPLKRMSLGDVSEMIMQLLEQDEIPAEFCELVYDRTRGNPFFVEEVIKSLKEEEVIYRGENQWRIKEVSKIKFPTTVKSVIKARVDRMNEECQNLLTLASFVGNDFSYEALCGVSGLAEDKVLDLTEQMLRLGLVKERVIREQDVYSFADNIVRDVVHEEVSHLRHKKLHGVVGCALEKIYEKKIDEHLGELALHFLEFGDEDKACSYFLRAGNKAAEIHANNEAFACFQHVLTLLEKKGGEAHEKAEVLEKLGNLKKLAGENDAGMEYWNEALLLWKQLDEKEKVARLHRKTARVLWESAGDAKKAEEHYDEALRVLEALPEGVELASLYSDMARMCYRTKDMAKALSWAEKALELAKKLGECEIICSSYASIGTVFAYIEERAKAIECLEKALKIALDNGYMDTALRAYNNLAIALPAERMSERVEYYEKGIELAKKVGDVVHQSWMSINVAGEYGANLGNMKQALMLLDEAVALSRKTNNLPHLSAALNSLGDLHQIMGEWDKSEQYLQEALSISQRLKDWHTIANSYEWLGWLHFDKGEYVKARDYYEKRAEIVQKAGAGSGRAHHRLIWTYIELGDIETAKTLLDEYCESALKTGNHGQMANGDALRGMLFRAQKKWEESIEHFEKSLHWFESVGARQWSKHWLARTILYEYARVFLERDQEGDREKAHRLLNQALELFQELGANKDIERIIAKRKLLTA